jgi:hypothetical protein
MAVVSTRQQLNLSVPGGTDTLLLNILDSGANLTSSKTLTLDSTVNLVTGAQSVNNLCAYILGLAADLATETTNRTNAVTNVTNSLNQEIADRQTAVSAEETARTTAVANVQTNLTNESTARAAADTALEGLLNTETTNRSNDVTTLTTNLNQEITDRQNAITTENSARVAADIALDDKINTLNSTSSNGLVQLESDLTDAIIVERERINAILALSATELNTFKEISDAYQAADTDLTTLITNLTTDFAALKLVVDTLVSNPSVP